ncbi:uncharacterized protein LOC117118738 [Anneissia japonica]|uniref:uncharacterized protein LOC117118738 n=1 Tax=Anneissia japonica TaxID=1529436 RepID=UPI001425A87E|nr:uncharacterized protein LOC117118738 [Anneissia japonica]
MIKWQFKMFKKHVHVFCFIFCCSCVFATTSIPNLDHENRTIAGQDYTSPKISSNFSTEKIKGESKSSGFAIPTVLIGTLSSILIVIVIKMALCYFHQSKHDKIPDNTPLDEDKDEVQIDMRDKESEETSDDKKNNKKKEVKGVVFETDEIKYKVFFVNSSGQISDVISTDDRERTDALPDVAADASLYDDNFCVISIEDHLLKQLDTDAFVVISLDDIIPISADALPTVSDTKSSQNGQLDNDAFVIISLEDILPIPADALTINSKQHAQIDDDEFTIISPDDIVKPCKPVTEDEFINISDKDICVLKLTHSYNHKPPSCDENYCVISYNKRASPIESTAAAYKRVDSLGKKREIDAKAKMTNAKQIMRYAGWGSLLLVDYGHHTALKLYNGIKEQNDTTMSS